MSVRRPTLAFVASGFFYGRVGRLHFRVWLFTEFDKVALIYLFVWVCLFIDVPCCIVSNVVDGDAATIAMNSSTMFHGARTQANCNPWTGSI